MNMAELRSKTMAELQVELVALSKELFTLRLQKGMQASSKPHLFRRIKKDIARIMTIQTEKQVKSS